MRCGCDRTEPPLKVQESIPSNTQMAGRNFDTKKNPYKIDYEDFAQHSQYYAD